MALNLDNIIEASERLDAQAMAQSQQARQRSAAASRQAPRQPMMMEEERPYNFKDEIDRLTADAHAGNIPQENLDSSHLPQNIIESFKENPCMFDPTLLASMSDPNVTKMQERLANKGVGRKNGSSAFERMKSLNERVEAIDNNGTSISKTTSQPLNETTNRPGIAPLPSFDYPTLRALMRDAVKEVMSEELGRIKAELLTENHQAASNSNNLSIMSLKDKFYFVDNLDNVYECVMKYRGKNQKKQK